MLSHLNLSAILLAAAAGIAAGAVWYGVFGTLWKRAHGMGEGEPRPGVIAFVLWGMGNLVAAFLLADLLVGFGVDSGVGGLIPAAMVWAGFSVTYMAMSNAFSERSYAVTLIDGGHALASLCAIGFVVGAMS